MTEGPLPEIRTSDGTVAQFPSEELIAERAESYRKWGGNVSRARPLGHETVVTSSDPRHWTPLEKPLSECVVALASSGGVHLKTQEPYDVFAEEGDSTVREIPGDVDTGDLTVTHTHYATEDALSDINVMFPLDRLRELADEGVVGGVSPLHLGMMGFIPNPKEVLAGPIPDIGEKMRSLGVDVILLTGG